jgi:hypothetical protein
MNQVAVKACDLFFIDNLAVIALTSSTAPLFLLSDIQMLRRRRSSCVMLKLNAIYFSGCSVVIYTIMAR